MSDTRVDIRRTGVFGMFERGACVARDAFRFVLIQLLNCANLRREHRVGHADRRESRCSSDALEKKISFLPKNKVGMKLGQRYPGIPKIV